MKSNWLPSALRFGDEETIALSDGVERTLTADEAEGILFTFTGALTANGVARLPELKPGRHYHVKNATTGGQSVSFRGPTGSSGATVGNGDLVELIVDHTNTVVAVGVSASINAQTQQIINMSNADQTVALAATTKVVVVRSSSALSADRTLTLTGATAGREIVLINLTASDTGHLKLGASDLSGKPQWIAAYIDLSSFGGPSAAWTAGYVTGAP